MLIISTLILSVSFFTQVAVLAAPIPLNGVPIDTRATSYYDALFGRTSMAQPTSDQTPPVQSGMFASTKW